MTPDDLFVLLPNRNAQGHCFKNFTHRAQLELRKCFFSVRVVNTWNSLSADPVTATCLETFKGLQKRDMGSLLFDYY